MSAQTDALAIRARFSSQWDDDIAFAVFANEPAVEIDQSKPFVRFSINESGRSPFAGDSVFQARGRVWLQIFVPASQGTMLAETIADAFTAIFHKWVSTDGAVRTFDYAKTPVPQQDDKPYQLNIGIYYESIRKI